MLVAIKLDSNGYEYMSFLSLLLWSFYVIMLNFFFVGLLFLTDFSFTYLRSLTLAYAKRLFSDSNP